MGCRHPQVGAADGFSTSPARIFGESFVRVIRTAGPERRNTRKKLSAPLSATPPAHHDRAMGFVIAAVSKYRMDNVPLLLRPWFILYGYGVGLAQFAYHCLIHWTCRIRLEGREALPAGNAIYCLWHGDLQSYFCVFLRHRGHTWLIHPSWYMKPIQFCMRLSGMETILGSTGHGGRKAAEQLVHE